MLKYNKRNKIIYIPYPEKKSNINEYTLNMIKILQEQYSVTGKIAKPVHIGDILHTKAIFLNWIEDKLNAEMKIQLMIYRILGVKIIWVFHNKYPHDIIQSKEIAQNMLWLARNSTTIVVHSKTSCQYIPDADKNKKKAVYVPHILYESHNDNMDTSDIRKKYGISENDFLYTIFGSIKPYKNIENGIKTFQRMRLQNSKLLITGSPYNSGYAKKIKTLCSEDSDIILDLRFISDENLDGIIDISDVILLPYKEGSSMNSGVMIKAFSKGKTVIAPDICMARDLAENKFFYIYKKSFQDAMMQAYQNGKKINKYMGDMAKNYIYKNNNREIVKKRLDKILK